MFIYLIRNVVDGRCYIGKTARSVAKRWLEHLRHARNFYKDGPLYEDLRNLPATTFEISTIYATSDQDDLNAAEKRFIEAFRAAETGYNQCVYPCGGLDRNGRIIKRKRIPKAQREKIARGVRNAWKEGRRNGQLQDHSPMQNAS